MGGIKLECREKCASCCIDISISSPIPGMPNGKPAGVKCIQLDENLKCLIFGKKERPLTCMYFEAEVLVCGNNSSEAKRILTELEENTK